MKKSYVVFDFNELGKFGDSLKEWVGKVDHIHVAVDVGASSGRICFQAFDKVGMRRPEEIQTLKVKFDETKDNRTFYKRMEDIRDEYVKLFVDNPVCYSCLGVAGPVKGRNHKPEGGIVEITNYTEGMRIIDLLKLPRELFPLEKTFFLNDMEANNYGLISLGAKGKLKEFFGPDFFNPKYPSEDVSPENMKEFSYYMINMGTGLGNGLLYYFEQQKKHMIIPMEIGHANMIPEYSNMIAEESLSEERREEYKKLRIFEEKYYHFLKHELLKETPEVEDYCSGKRGVTNLLEGFSRYGDILGPDYVVNKDKYPNAEVFSKDEKKVGEFLKDHPMINLFQWRKLFYVIQQVSVTFPSIKGIFLCGNNISREHNRGVVIEHRQLILDEFFSNKRPCIGWLGGTECFIQKKMVNTNLIGSFYILQKIVTEELKKK